jgi:phospholipid:diacylglycerol acyltransferase
MASNYSFGIERDEEVLKRNDFDHTKWTNPLEHRYVTLFDPNLYFVAHSILQVA